MKGPARLRIQCFRNFKHSRNAEAKLSFRLAKDRPKSSSFVLSSLYQTAVALSISTMRHRRKVSQFGMVGISSSRVSSPFKRAISARIPVANSSINRGQSCSDGSKIILRNARDLFTSSPRNVMSREQTLVRLGGRARQVLSQMSSPVEDS
ncbi:hypothetical protein M427DRAFT_288799 [Gonapodya prolifera JEL478]|uniref:Uncharacterized protein n=1 Tax=Gonapodya prolifera (strain JEL478) TaxID=1344416 RepID=A0A139AIL3_GONPJ|nr:hypothetical protein M427DRAFT_288799 [Gonapodya prolifera JEL478]|eukprot:KXS16646.1 hypothetical protein M427DRAFT_288799 [Gonapodya prolifera JEL478]